MSINIENNFFYIHNWAAWAPGHTTQQDWQKWAKTPKLIPQKNNAPVKFQFPDIPNNIQRRCSQISKMALHVSNQALGNQNIQYAVFGAQHGELKRAAELFEYIAQRESLSPMSFTQSVHNTSSGLLSIIHKMTNNITAIAANENTFCVSFIEALLWLNLYPSDQILITVYDADLPLAYEALKIQYNQCYALSFLIKKTPPNPEDQTLQKIYWQLTNQQIEYPLNQHLPQAFNFLCWYLNGQNNAISFKQSNSNLSLIWHKEKHT